MISKELLGLKIKSGREKRSLTQDELALLVHLDGKSISNYERGTAFPSMQSLIDIAKALKMPLEYFVSNEPQMNLIARVYVLQDQVEELLREIKDLKDLIARIK